jgi:hypothetical protein
MLPGVTGAAATTRRRSTRRLRQILVLMHMTTAFGWLTCSIAMLLLVSHGLAQKDQASRRIVFETAVQLDDRLLADFSFMTVYTGLMLAGLSHWGFVRFWWVTVSIGLATTCALTGRQIFPRLLDASADGDSVSSGQLVGVTLVMIAALVFLVFIGRIKPWGRIGAARGPEPPWGHPALYVAIMVTPVLDYLTDLPLQVIPAVIVLGYHARRTLLDRGRSRTSGGHG